MDLKTGMDVLLDKKGIAIPDGDFSVDVTLAEDVDLTIECMVNLFLRFISTKSARRMP